MGRLAGEGHLPWGVMVTSEMSKTQKHLTIGFPHSVWGSRKGEDSKRETEDSKCMFKSGKCFAERGW